MFARMMPLVPALLVILAAAEQDTYAIVDVDAAPDMVGLGVQTTKTLVDAAAALKLNALTPEQVHAKLTDAQYTLLIKCGASPACVSQYASHIGTKKVVLGAVGRNEKNYLLKLWLIDVEKSEVVADVDRQVLIAARRFQKDVEQAAPPLLRGEKEARGTLSITTNVKNVQLSINGSPVGTTPYETQLRPGKYEVKVERTKYLSVTRFVAVEPNEKTEVPLKLLLIPGAMPDEEPAAVGAKTNTGASGQPMQVTAKTFIAGGATLVAFGIATGFGIAARSGDKAITDGFDSVAGTYKATRQEALNVQSNALAANVAFGIGGAAAIATIVFVILDATSGPGEVQVAPTASTSGAGLVIGGRF